MLTFVRFGILLCAALAASTRASAQAGLAAAPNAIMGPDISLENVDLSGTPFSSVQVCWPINTLIQPGSNYSLELQAETSVLQALSWDVTNSSLQLSTNGSFRTLYPIVAIVTLPGDALEAVANPSSLAATTVDAGFSASSFTVAAPFSSGDIYILGLDAGALHIQSSGLGMVVANGTFVNTSIIASGVGNVYVIGVEDQVAVNLAGTAAVSIGAASSNVTITGQATGVNSISYDVGTCSVSSPFLLSDPCEQFGLINTPAIDPMWTCGLRSSGNFTCPAGGLAASEAVSAANVFPLAAALITPSPVPVPSPVRAVPSPVAAAPVAAPVPAVPSPSPPAPVPSPSPVVFPSPPPPVLPAFPIVSPSPIPSPSPNTVIRSGQGPQFASAVGTGSQTAISNSGPNAQQTSIGQNSLIPPSPENLFGTGTGIGATGNLEGDGINSFGKRRLQQIQVIGSLANRATSAQTSGYRAATQILPCAESGSSQQIFG